MTETTADAREMRPGSLVGALTTLSLPALFGASAIHRASALHPVALESSAYWQPAHALILYLLSPVVAVSAVILFLTPGLLLAAATSSRRMLGDWLPRGFVYSLLLISTTSAVVQELAGRPVSGGLFGAIVLACAVPGAVLLFLRSRAAPLYQATDIGSWKRAAMAWLAPLFLVVVVLAPKIYWESFNGDGAHAYEVTRLLLHQAVPFLPREAGPISSFPGVTSMLFTYPGSWFMRLLGPGEASARLPLLLYLTLLVAVLGALSRREGERPPYGMIWATLAGYVLAMAFSASYNPYSADLALPATQDTLLIVCFLAFVLAFVRREWPWTAAWAVLCYLSLPNGALLLAMWLVAAAIVIRPRPWGMMRVTVVTIAACLVLGVIAARTLPLIGLPPPGREYGMLGMLRYFAFLQITDWHRFLYIAVPAGVLPLLATLAWRWQDETSRAITLVTWAYFLFFFVQANVSLHHFVPSMVMPLAVFWRILQVRRGRLAAVLPVAAAVLAVLLAMPASWAPHTTGREVGATIVENIGGYDVLNPAELRASSILEGLFPLDWDPSVPGEAYGGSPLVWNHYALHDPPEIPGEANYLVTASGEREPAGWHLVREQAGFALYVRDEAVLERHRALQPATNSVAPLLAVPRWVLFRTVRPEGNPRVLDVANALKRAGVDVDPLLRRLRGQD